MVQLWQRLIRFGFRLLYNELAWTYDVVSWLVSLGEWQSWLGAARPFLHGHYILEIGHGPGHLLRQLAGDGKFVVGLDLSLTMGRMAQKRLVRSGQIARLVRGRVQNLPFAAGTFDTVVATFPTDYVVDPDTLRAVYRVLGANGRFVIIPEGHLTGGGVVHRLIAWLFRITGQRSSPYTMQQPDEWRETAVWQPLRQRFADAGFQVKMTQVARPRSVVTVILAEK